MLMFNVSVAVKLKSDVMDPQGQAILQAAQHLGFTDFADLRAGRYFELVVDAEGEAEARQRAGELCSKLLANPVIETWEIIAVVPAARSEGAPR